jgi:nitric oxide dioxygenase
MKAREVVIRQEIEGHIGGWNGWRPFTVAGKIRESSVITSFILRPVDGGPVARLRPGQYLTLRFDAVDGPNLKRNCSISCAPNNDCYRISVKREGNGNGGSRHLHDHVEVDTVIELTPPARDFFLEETPQRPVILLSGGVGLTPMVSMVETIAAEHPGLSTHYIHGTTSSATHAMDGHVRLLARTHGNISVATFIAIRLRAMCWGRRTMSRV